MNDQLQPEVSRDERMPIGVLLAARPPKTAWGEEQWTPHDIVAGTTDLAPWTKMRVEGDATIWFAGQFELELFVGEDGVAQTDLGLAGGPLALEAAADRPVVGGVFHVSTPHGSRVGRSARH
jgi:hypothetical protein